MLFCLFVCFFAGNNTAVTPTLDPPTPPPTSFDAQCSASYLTLSAQSRSAKFADASVEVCDDSGSVAVQIGLSFLTSLVRSGAGQVISGAMSNQDWQGPGWSVSFGPFMWDFPHLTFFFGRYRFEGSAGTRMLGLEI